jgi:hypothetical protein
MPLPIGLVVRELWSIEEAGAFVSFVAESAIVTE